MLLDLPDVLYFTFPSILCTLQVNLPEGSAKGMKSRRLSLKSEMFGYRGYYDYLRKFTKISIICLASLVLMCLKYLQSLKILLKSLKSWSRVSSVADLLNLETST